VSLTVSLILWWLLAPLALYGLAVSGLFVVMCQPPARFGRFMRHFPMPAMALVPFLPLWNVARRGRIRVGEMAPDFSLPSVDRSRVVRLSSFRGDRPVVLVFGSYT
jgi:hypothetical protein